MRVLVAGGAGFIGSHLCERLLEDDCRVVCVDNLITGRQVNIRHLAADRRFRFVRADITRELTVSGRFDVIYNLASPASPRDYLEHPLATLKTGSIGTWNLLERARRGRSVFLQASTSEVYGDPEVHPQSEDYAGNVNPVGVRSVYDEAKRFSEALTMSFHRRWRMPTRIARIFNTYGPRMKLDDGRVVPNLISQALNGEPLTIYGTGRQTRSFCYVSDMVEGLLRLAAADCPEPVNIGNPREFSILRFARLVLKQTGADSPLEFLPLPQDDPRRRRPDINRARTVLEWEPCVRLEDGLKQTIESFRTTLKKQPAPKRKRTTG